VRTLGAIPLALDSTIGVPLDNKMLVCLEQRYRELYALIGHAIGKEVTTYCLSASIVYMEPDSTSDQPDDLERR